MRTIFIFIQKYKFIASIAILLMLIELVAELLQPLMMSKIIDEGIMADDPSKIVMWGLLLIALTVFAFGIGIISSFYSAHVAQNFSFDLRQKLYEVVQNFTYSVFSKFQESSLMTRMTNDVVQLQNTVFMGLRIMLRAPLLVIGSSILAAMLDVSLSMYIIIMLPFVFYFLIWVLRRSQKVYKQVQARLDGVNRVMQQSLIGIRLIRVFERTNYESEKFSKASEELKKFTISAMRLTELSLPIVSLMLNASVLFILWFAREGLQNGSITSVGDTVAIINYAMRISGALSAISMVIMNISRANASSFRVQEVLNAEEVDPQNTNSKEHNDKTTSLQIEKFEYRSVSYRYPDSEMLILSNISFEVKRGEMVAIMGSTGSGKSTLLQLLPQLYIETEGEIRLNGSLISEFPVEHVRREIGYVAQEILLFSGTVADNIRWGKREATMEDVIEAARMAQIHDTIMKLPQGYDTMIGQKGVNLSGGQKQRMTIARALVRKPQVLLLDDCTSALDVNTEATLLSEIRKLQCTVLLVTQKMSSTLIADRIMIIDDGQLIADGKHEQLLQHSSLYQKIHQSQQYKGFKQTAAIMEGGDLT